MNNIDVDDLSTEPEAMLLGAAIKDHLIEKADRVVFSRTEDGGLHVTFNRPERYMYECRDEAELGLRILCETIVDVLLDMAAKGYPLPPFRS